MNQILIENAHTHLTSTVLLSSGYIPLAPSCPPTVIIDSDESIKTWYRRLALQGLNKRARSMIDGNTLTTFWVATIFTATNLQKRIPTVVLEGLSPYEALYKEKQPFQHLRKIRCAAYHLQPNCCPEEIRKEERKEIRNEEIKFETKRWNPNRTKRRNPKVAKTS